MRRIWPRTRQRLEGGADHVAASRRDDEVPSVRPPQCHRAAVEREPLRHAVRVDPCIERAQSRGESFEILVVARGRETRVRGDAGKAIQSRRERADEDESDAMPRERREQQLWRKGTRRIALSHV